jgi:Holliday junction resolvasome RuvABC endonuclease subunit
VRVAAFDISSKLGWAAWDGAAPNPVLDTKTLVGFQYDAGTMLELYRKWLGPWLKAYQPELLVIEAWIVAGHGDASTAAKLILLSGFTQWACHTQGIRSVLVPAATWRKTVFGSARGKSAEFKAKAMARAKHYGWHDIDNNAAEAGLILEYAAMTLVKVTPPWKLAARAGHVGDLLV